MDMCTTILRMRRQSQMHRQSHLPIAQYLPALFSCEIRNKGPESDEPLKAREGPRLQTLPDCEELRQRQIRR